jgi:hypothetical protein
MSPTRSSRPYAIASSISGRHCATGSWSVAATSASEKSRPTIAAAWTIRRQSAEIRSSRALTTSSTVRGGRSGRHVPSAIARATSRTNNGLPPVTSRTARASAAGFSAVVLDSCSRTSARSKPRRSRRSTAGDRSRSGSTRGRTLAGSASRNAAKTSSRPPAIWSARWRRTRSDGSSPQWMSSRMTTRPFLSATPRTASVTSSKTRNRSSGDSMPASRMSGSTPSERSTWRHGQYAGAPSASTQRPHATAVPPARATPASSWASRVLPIPGSPTQRTSRPAPSRAASSHARNASSSRRRPTMPSPLTCTGPRVGVLTRPVSPVSAGSRRCDVTCLVQADVTDLQS